MFYKITLCGITSCLLLACQHTNNSVQVSDAILKSQQVREDESIEMNKRMVAEGEIKIKQYIASKNLSMQRTGTGLYYRIEGEATGNKVLTKDIVHLKTKVYLLNDSLCYETAGDSVSQFVVGYAAVESGLQEGLKYMCAGQKGIFLLPTHLAHGLSGDNNKIPPATAIRYDVELLKIEKQN